MKIIIHSESEDIDSTSKKSIRNAVSTVLKSENKSHANVSIVFLSATKMQGYNQRYRGKDYYPDILSFPSESLSYLGDILLCKPIIDAQAKRHKVPAREELLRLVIHGILHLLGYQHKSYDKAEHMLQYQEELLEKVLKNSCINS